MGAIASFAQAPHILDVLGVRFARPENRRGVVSHANDCKEVQAESEDEDEDEDQEAYRPQGRRKRRGEKDPPQGREETHQAEDASNKEGSSCTCCDVGHLMVEAEAAAAGQARKRLQGGRGQAPRAAMKSLRPLPVRRAQRLQRQV